MNAMKMSTEACKEFVNSGEFALLTSELVFGENHIVLCANLDYNDKRVMRVQAVLNVDRIGVLHSLCMSIRKRLGEVPGETELEIGENIVRELDFVNTRFMSAMTSGSWDGSMVCHDCKDNTAINRIVAFEVLRKELVRRYRIRAKGMVTDGVNPPSLWLIA